MSKFEKILSVVIAISVVSFIMMTFSPEHKVINNSIEICSNNYNQSNHPNEVVKSNLNPEKWIVLGVSEDYSSAHILKENGHSYYVTIYEATDETISIVVGGEIHTYYY